MVSKTRQLGLEEFHLRIPVTLKRRFKAVVAQDPHNPPMLPEVRAQLAAAVRQAGGSGRLPPPPRTTGLHHIVYPVLERLRAARVNRPLSEWMRYALEVQLGLIIRFGWMDRLLPGRLSDYVYKTTSDIREQASREVKRANRKVKRSDFILRVSSKMKRLCERIATAAKVRPNELILGLLLREVNTREKLTPMLQQIDAAYVKLIVELGGTSDPFARAKTLINAESGEDHLIHGTTRSIRKRMNKFQRLARAYNERVAAYDHAMMLDGGQQERRDRQAQELRDFVRHHDLAKGADWLEEIETYFGREDKVRVKSAVLEGGYQPIRRKGAERNPPVDCGRQVPRRPRPDNLPPPPAPPEPPPRSATIPPVRRPIKE